LFLFVCFFALLFVCCMYKEWATKTSACTTTFEDLLCFICMLFQGPIWSGTGDTPISSVSASAVLLLLIVGN
jgi:hypothetical protein